MSGLLKGLLTGHNGHMTDVSTTTTLTWTLGDRLRKARRFAGLTAVDMAEHLRLSANTISNWENDNTVPTRAAVLVWAARTGVPVAWLDGDDQAIERPADPPRPKRRHIARPMSRPTSEYGQLGRIAPGHGPPASAQAAQAVDAA